MMRDGTLARLLKQAQRAGRVTPFILPPLTSFFAF